MSQHEMVHLLTPQGELVQHPGAEPALSDEQVLDAWRQMVLARRLDLEATSLQRQGELGLWAPMQGQEATQVGAALALGAHDHVYPSYREHALLMERGVDPVDILGLFRGTSLGHWDFDATRCEPYTLVVGAQALHAVGHAMGFQLDGLVGPEAGDRARAVLVFHGDGASSQGEVNEAYLFAVATNAPVVFLCQNNGWAISEPTSVQSPIPLYQRAHGFGLPGIQVDGNDLLAVHSVVTDALARARRGEGPTLVEAVTYRMGAHTTSDDPRRYRSDEEVTGWAGRDPIERVRLYLVGRGVLDEAATARVEAEADAFGERVREQVRTLRPPSFAETFDEVYAEPAPHLAEQLAAHEDFQARLEQPGPDQQAGAGA